MAEGLPEDRSGVGTFFGWGYLALAHEPCNERSPSDGAALRRRASGDRASATGSGKVATFTKRHSSTLGKVQATLDGELDRSNPFLPARCPVPSESYYSGGAHVRSGGAEGAIEARWGDVPYVRR